MGWLYYQVGDGLFDRTSDEMEWNDTAIRGPVWCGINHRSAFRNVHIDLTSALRIGTGHG